MKILVNGREAVLKANASFEYVSENPLFTELFYQDVNEQFEGYTQQHSRHFVRRRVVLSGFQ